MPFLSTEDRREAFRAFVADLAVSPSPTTPGKRESIDVTKWELWDRLVEIDRLVTGAPGKVAAIEIEKPIEVGQATADLKSTADLKIEARAIVQAEAAELDVKAEGLIGEARARLVAVVLRQRKVAADRLVDNEEGGDLMDTKRPKNATTRSKEGEAIPIEGGVIDGVR